MENCLAGQSLSVSFVASGQAASARLRILDQNEQVIADWAPLSFGHTPVMPADQATVTLTPAQTTLPAGQLSGMLVLRVEYRGDADELLGADEKLVRVRAESILRVPTNSFVSYYTAVMVADDMPTTMVSGWETYFDRQQRETALAEAHARIMSLPLVLAAGAIKEIGEIDWLTRVAPEELSALAKAQVLEAAEILQSDPISRARASGAISMTVGESSQFFGTARPLEVGMVSSKAALRVLGPWLRIKPKLGRA